MEKEDIIKILKTISPEEIIEIFKETLEENKDKSFNRKSYVMVDLALEKPVYPKLTKLILKKINFDDKEVFSRNTFKAFIDTDTPEKTFGIYIEVEVNDKYFKMLLPLTQLQKNEFCLNIKKGIYFCEGEISYSDELELFTIHYLKIYNYFNPIIEYQKIFACCSNSIKERIDLLLTKLGFNPDNLLFNEKIIFILRLVPLVQRKYMMVDLSKKGIGKTTLYQLLDFNLYTTCVTRSTAFVDGRNGKEGDFFNENIVYIVDEINKINDSDFISTLQVYKNGDDCIGMIQASKINKKSSNSVILLGNSNINIDYNYIFENRQNLFNNTIIEKEGSDSAFLDRIDGLLPSYGCRPFNSFMKSEKGNDREFIEIFKSSFNELREKKITIDKLLEKYDLLLHYDSIREENAILKTFEGLLKILYPEILISSEDLLSSEILDFLFIISVQVRQSVKNQISIIEDTDYKNIYYYPAYFRDAYFKFNGKKFYTPHSVIVSSETEVKIIPFDTVGLTMNQNYKKFLEKRYQCEFVENTGELKLNKRDYYYNDYVKSFKANNNDNYNFLIGIGEWMR